MNEWLSYERGADVYAAIGEDDPMWRRRHRERLLTASEAASIADMGCGPGFDLAWFASKGLETYGVDGSAAMLNHARKVSPSSVLIQQDLREHGAFTVNAIWSMFTLLHIPEEDLLMCFRSWRDSLTPKGILMVGLAESDRLRERDVSEWLGQPQICRFYYHRCSTVSGLLEAGGYTLIETVYDTPECYRGGSYDELGLSAYIISARKVL